MAQALILLKSVGPKLVPFIKAVAIYFLLFGDDSKPESNFYCALKCLPIISLMAFVMLYGPTLPKRRSYTRNILIGLLFSCLGDAFLVWKDGYFLHGIVMFALAHVFYAMAFGFEPFRPREGAICAVVASMAYCYVSPGLRGTFLPLGTLYFLLISTMVWRAVARVHLAGGTWPWSRLCGCIGAVLFFISDFILAVNTFRHHLPYSHPLVMSTYYAGQLGIALSVVDSQVDAALRDTTRSAKDRAVS